MKTSRVISYQLQNQSEFIVHPIRVDSIENCFYLDVCTLYRIDKAYNTYVIKAGFAVMVSQSLEDIDIKSESTVESDDFEPQSPIAVRSPSLISPVSLRSLEKSNSESKNSITMPVSYGTVTYDDIESQASNVIDTLPSYRSQKSLHSPSPDISAIEKDTQLRLQQQFLNSVTVHGLPIRNNDQRSLLSLFKILCDYICVPFENNEIEHIESDGRCLSIKFYKKHKKDEILRSYRTKGLKSDDVLMLSPGEKPEAVKFYQKTTKFYQQLMLVAQNYIRKRQLYSYGMADQGLGIKLSRDDEIFYVRSQYELEQYVLQAGY